MSVLLDRLISLLAPSFCLACGAASGRAGPLCPGCRGALERGRPVQGAGAGCWAAFPYDGPAGALVRALKFGGRAGVADTMAAHLAANAPPGLLAGTIVPVPMHPAHRRRRGLDHSRALADALAERSGLPLRACLVRSGDPRPQVGRGRSERIRGPAGAIRCAEAAPPRALLIDDVVTTGSTLAACTLALRQAGAREVAAIVYARTSAR